MGYCHLEKLYNLESLPADGLMIACCPVKMRGASAGWTRAVAMVEGYTGPHAEVGMAVVYVIQVMAHHGYGLEGWRTVRRASGAPYVFQTHEAAHAALVQHFGNLREGINVRVFAMEAEAATAPLSVVPLDGPQ